MSLLGLLSTAVLAVAKPPTPPPAPPVAPPISFSAGFSSDAVLQRSSVQGAKVYGFTTTDRPVTVEVPSFPATAAGTPPPLPPQDAPYRWWCWCSFSVLFRSRVGRVGVALRVQTFSSPTHPPGPPCIAPSPFSKGQRGRRRGPSFALQGAGDCRALGLHLRLQQHRVHRPQDPADAPSWKVHLGCRAQPHIGPGRGVHNLRERRHRTTTSTSFCSVSPPPASANAATHVHQCVIYICDLHHSITGTGRIAPPTPK